VQHSSGQQGLWIRWLEGALEAVGGETDGPEGEMIGCRWKMMGAGEG
jgi:hypothetical protein